MRKVDCMKRRFWFIHIGVIALIVLLTVVGCPIYRLTGILCPTCGVTRSWLAFIRGDFTMAFAYHGMFFLIPPFLFAVAHRNAFLKIWQPAVDVFLFASAALLFTYNVLRWLNVIIMP